MIEKDSMNLNTASHLKAPTAPKSSLEVLSILPQIEAMAKIFGQLFYYPLTSPQNKTLFQEIQNQIPEDDTFNLLIQNINKEDTLALNQDFQTLFEGVDIMPAPPWGSVYLDKEQVIFGDSTLKFRQFLRANQLELNTGMREPEDQFGLMLFALAALCQQANDPQNRANSLKYKDAIHCFFEQHFLPWAPEYLSLAKNAAITKSYQEICEMALDWLCELQQEVEFEIKPLQIYFTHR